MQITRTASIIPQIVVEDLLRCCEVGRGSPNGFHWESVSVSAAPRHHGFDHTAFTAVEALATPENLGILLCHTSYIRCNTCEPVHYT